MDDKVEKIVKSLIGKSDNGDVFWNSSSNKEGFKLQLNEATLCVLRKDSGNGIYYILEIYNVNGERIVNQSISGTIQPNLLKDLYCSAKRSYYKEDATLKSILNQVTLPGKIGEDDSLPF